MKKLKDISWDETEREKRGRGEKGKKKTEL